MWGLFEEAGDGYECSYQELICVSQEYQNLETKRDLMLLEVQEHTDRRQPYAEWKEKYLLTAKPVRIDYDAYRKAMCDWKTQHGFSADDYSLDMVRKLPQLEIQEVSEV